MALRTHERGLPYLGKDRKNRRASSQAVADMMEERGERPGVMTGGGSVEWARTRKGHQQEPAQNPLHDGLTT